MPVSSPVSAKDMPFVCTKERGILGMTRTLEDAQQHCQELAMSPLTWTRRGGRRWIATDGITGLTYTTTQLLF